MFRWKPTFEQIAAVEAEQERPVSGSEVRAMKFRD
jgi:hypothetical protein